MSANAVINLAVLLLGIGFVYSRFKPVKGVKTLNADEFRKAMKAIDTRVVDVREPGEYKRGFIAGALNIPVSQIQQRLDEIPQDMTVLMYCQSGMRSKNAAGILTNKGYTQLAHLKGGIAAWNDKLTR